MYCARTDRQATPPECHETIAQTTDSALYSTCRACAMGQRLMASVQWAKEGGADASPIYNDEETMTKTAKSYTIIDVCEQTGLPYGTVYAAIRHLQRGKPVTAPSQKTVKEALKTMRIGAADLVAAPKGPKTTKRGGDSPLDELTAAQALAAAVAPAPEESKIPDVPAADPAAPQPDEGDPGTLDQAVDEVANLTAMPSPAPLPRVGDMPKYTGEEFDFFHNHAEASTEQAVIQGISSLHRALSLHELPLEDLLAELQRRMPQAEVVVRIGPAAAA